MLSETVRRGGIYAFKAVQTRYKEVNATCIVPASGLVGGFFHQ